MKKIIFLLLLLSGCKKHITEPYGNIKYWTHVYDYSRLTIYKNNIKVIGVIKDSQKSEDGDQIYKLSTPDQFLLNAGNIFLTKGYLQLEVICVNPVYKNYVGGKCECYENDIWLPQIGDSVMVEGPWVYDKHHGWMEIHPVVKITKL